MITFVITFFGSMAVAFALYEWGRRVEQRRWRQELLRRYEKDIADREDMKEWLGKKST